MDPPTAFFVLAWDAFRAPVFPYDEALKLARAVGADLDRGIIGRMAEKKASNLRLWDSEQRAANGTLGPPDGSKGMIDAVHHAARAARTRSTARARELLAAANADRNPRFHAALKAVLEVLPVSQSFTRIELPSGLESWGNDFDALYAVYRLAFTTRSARRNSSTSGRTKTDPVLARHEWKLKYNSDDGNLVQIFYVPALREAVRYDRVTGYFNAGALALAARGIEGLVRNGGAMRLIVGCTLDEAEIQAIQDGKRLREQIAQQVDKHLSGHPLAPPDAEAVEAVELLAWMVKHRFLEVKVAVPCDERRRPTASDALFHEKTGVIQDSAGTRIAWTGSLNETAAGWQKKLGEHSRIRKLERRAARPAEENSFARLWDNQTRRAIVLDVSEAVERDLLRFLPKENTPSRLKDDVTYSPQSSGKRVHGEKKPASYKPGPHPDTALRRDRVWSFIKQAPKLDGGGGDLVGLETSAVSPWRHQMRALPASLRRLAAQVAHCGRSRARQNHTSRHVASSGVAVRPRETDSHHGAQGGARAVAD